MILGGKVAAEFREIVEGTFTRVMAGDQSLIEVINANAASQDPVQKAYRAGLAQEPVDPALDDFCLKRKREREDLLFDMEMAERKLRLEECQLRIDDGKLALDERKVTLDERKVTLDERKVTLDERKLHHETKMIEHINTSMGSINALKDWANVDERTKLQAEDHIKNLLFNKLAAAPVDPSSSSMDGPTITLPNTPLSIGNVAHELGYKLSGEDLRRVGVAVKKRYDQQDNTEPLSKHLEICGGRPTYVNSYSEKYRSLIAEVIHADQEKALKSKRCKPLETYFKSS
jgi:hypothetical protein